MSLVRLDPQAQFDLVEIVEYLMESAGSVRAADAFLRELDRKCEIYARQPEMGDLRDDLPADETLRSFTFRRWYIAIYEPLAEGINVLRVFDGRTDYLRHFGG